MHQRTGSLSFLHLCIYAPPPPHTQLLPNLYHLGSAAREELNSSSVGPIQEKLESMAGEVTMVLDQQLQVERTHIKIVLLLNQFLQLPYEAVR